MLVRGWIIGAICLGRKLSVRIRIVAGIYLRLEIRPGHSLHSWHHRCVLQAPLILGLCPTLVHLGETWLDWLRVLIHRRWLHGIWGIHWSRLSGISTKIIEASRLG